MNSKYFNFHTGLVIGIALTILTSRLFFKNKSNNFDRQKESIFNKERKALKNLDPFSQLQKQLNSMNRNSMSLSFGNLGALGTLGRLGNELTVNNREDNQFHYIEIDAQDIDPESLNIEVKDGLVHISGRIKKITKSKFGSSSFISSFNKSLSTPDGVNQDGVQIFQKGKKIILKFPKL